MTCFEAKFYFKENKTRTITFTVTPHTEKSVTFKLSHPSTINLKVTTLDNCDIKLQYIRTSLDPVEDYEKFIVIENNTFLSLDDNLFFVKPS